ncbi:MAG: hypothetical protein ACKO5P_10640 [Nodosilinea sp.]
MVQPFRQSPPVRSTSLSAAAGQPGLVGRVLPSNRLTYRPFLLVGLFWVVLVAVAALAYHQLMHSPASSTFTELPQAPLTADPASPEATAALMDPVQPREQRLAQPTPTVLKPNSAKSQLNPGWLLCFIGLCALGCFAISQQVQKPRRRRLYARGGGPRPRSPAPKRLSPYSPQRDRVIVPQAVSDVPPLSPPDRQQNSPPPIVDSLSTATTVVSDREDLPLDWPETSLAHSLDLRQRRSLSSLF